MKIDFQKAFAVDIKHDFYPDGTSADFLISPTPDCRRQLLKYGMLFKETPGGFLVLYETTGEAGPPVPKRKIEQPLNLAFVLWAKAPFLMNYSNLPLDKEPDQIFYLSNRAKTLNNGQRLLSANTETEFLSAIDLVTLRPQRFQVTLDSDSDSILWEVVDSTGSQLLRNRVQTVEGTSTFLVDLGGKAPGLYLLRRDGADYLNFYAADRLVSGFPFGVIEIAADPQVSSEFSIIDGLGSIQFRLFQLKLQARKTTWEYYVVGKYETGLAPNDLQVLLDDPPVAFSRQNSVVLPDGSTAVPFIAGTELPLSQQPIRGITLQKKKGPTTPRLVIDNLPNPSVAEVIPVDNKVISRKYIYI